MSSNHIEEVRTLVERHRDDGFAPVEEVTDVFVIYRARMTPLDGGEPREMLGSFRSGMTDERVDEILEWVSRNLESERVCCCGWGKGYGCE